MLLGVAFSQGAIGEALWGGVCRLGPANLHPLALRYGLRGSAMISATLRIPKW
jgi:CDP-diacylglycerol--serine O-phosphatidyltransferase